MTIPFQIRIADSAALPEIASFLRKYNLPDTDLFESDIHFLTMRDHEDRLIGTIGLEKMGADGLLRSFAVSSDYRSKAIGTTLYEELLQYSKGIGINQLHLLTDTAEEYFKRKGFMLADRTGAPDGIRASAEFASICPASSAYMVLEIL